jgi:hypothetical protein
MTPKEKAEDLFLTFYQRLPDSVYSDDGAKHEAKQCALITVDEILQAESSLWEKASNMAYRLSYEQTTDFTYWQQVKQEIEKL